MAHCTHPLLLTSLFITLSVSSALGQVSDGSDGAFNPAGNVTVDLNSRPDGVFNFTTITIKAGVTVGFLRNTTTNTPVIFLATGNVEIHGAINLSAPASDFVLGGAAGGPGGGDGGVAGLAFTSGGSGAGLSPGGAGLVGNPRPGQAGGGGGMATGGQQASRYSALPPASGGGAIPFPDPLSGGSGGGGGGGWNLFGVPLDGGEGGGGGGALRIVTPANISIDGRILANGAWGGTAFANIFGYGGPGGGGSGGVIDLQGDGVILQSTGLLQAKGGPGGGISTLPIFSPVFSNEANGGLGYVRLAGNTVRIDGHLEAFPVLGANSSLPLNPFLCYKIVTTDGAPEFSPPPAVTLTDQFETSNFDVKKPVSLCNPANKNNEGLVDPITHLKGYQITLTRRNPPQTKHVKRTNLQIVNQLGTIVVDTIKPDRLLEPTNKSLTEPVDPPDPDTHGVDPFLCYTVKINKDAEKFPKDVQVSVVDQFAQPKLYDVKKPTRLCTPVSEDGGAIKDAGRHLLCYQVHPAQQQPKHEKVLGIFVHNRFGAEQVDTVKEEELCVPSLKILP